MLRHRAHLRAPRRLQAFRRRIRRADAQYRLGNPLDQETDARADGARRRRGDSCARRSSEAVGKGAQALVDAKAFPADKEGTPYVAPQVLVDVDHSMRVMSEESFGPVVGIMPVDGDEQAVELMNDSRYGLTASIWTPDRGRRAAIGDRSRPAPGS